MRLSLAVLGGLWLLAVQCAWAQEESPKRINAHLANEVIPLSSNASTVGGFISELSIQLPDGAAVEPPLESALRDGMSVFLHGLTVTRGETEELLPPVLDIEESWRFGPTGMELVDPGQAGQLRVTCTIFYYGGREVGRRCHEDVIQPMSPTRVVCYRSLNKADGPTVEQILEMRLKPGDYHLPPDRYREVRTMTSTAYEPGPKSCGRFASGNTAGGYKAGYGVVAVDTSIIPMHSRLFIEGYGYAVAGDRGSAIKGNRIDVGFRTVDECMKWGRRKVKVYILY
jgi:3D (Asp-Asp-Asp) domain-containing protein